MEGLARKARKKTKLTIKISFVLIILSRRLFPARLHRRQRAELAPGRRLDAVSFVHPMVAVPGAWLELIVEFLHLFGHATAHHLGH